MTGRPDALLHVVREQLLCIGLVSWPGLSLLRLGGRQAVWPDLAPGARLPGFAEWQGADAEYFWHRA